MTAASPLDPCVLIPPIARALAARFHVERSELEQTGRIAAFAAITDLDPGRAEASKRAYLRLRIRGAMLDPIRRELQRREVPLELDVAMRGDARRCEVPALLLLLPPRARAILELRIQGFSQAAVGLRFQISQSRVSRLEARAVRKLRTKAR